MNKNAKERKWFLYPQKHQKMVMKMNQNWILLKKKEDNCREQPMPNITYILIG